jgi:hypothetical protein
MSLSTNTMTLNITVDTVYPDSYAMDVRYTLVVDTSTSYTVTNYISIPFSTATDTVTINGVNTAVTVISFLTGTTLTNYLNSVAPIQTLIKTASAADQFDYLTTFVGTGTVSF